MNSCRYVFCCSYSHNVAPKGKFIAFVSTEAETDNPQVELKPGIDLLGPVDELFFDLYDRYEPVNEPSLDNCFISTVWSFPWWWLCSWIWSIPGSFGWHYFFKPGFLLPLIQSYDATTHFESTVTDVLNMYTAITGKVKSLCNFLRIKFPLNALCSWFGHHSVGFFSPTIFVGVLPVFPAVCLYVQSFSILAVL